MIILRYVTAPGFRERIFRYKTLKGAQMKALTLVGHNPKLDPDGYAVERTTGNCLFFQGTSFGALFPGAKP